MTAEGGDLRLVAATPNIGQRNRWLAPVAAADLDGDGATEIAYVDRPHLARRLRIWRFEGGSLTEIAALPGLTNHRIGEAFITGGLRVGVGEGLTLRALGQAFGIDPAVLQHRWMTPQHPTAAAFEALVNPHNATLHWAAPYPFCLAQPLRDGALPPLPSTAVQAEWKWDGVRCQLVRREGKTALWSRGRERLEDRFPELAAAAEVLPEGTVLDGELLAWAEDGPGPFVELSRRLQRKRITTALQRAVPVRFMAYDLLELHGEDLRPYRLSERRQRLEVLLARTPAPALTLSPRLDNRSWESLAALRAEARSQAAEGLMLKHEASAYESGRRHQSWWKWKLAVVCDFR